MLVEMKTLEDIICQEATILPTGFLHRADVTLLLAAMGVLSYLELGDQQGHSRACQASRQ